MRRIAIVFAVVALTGCYHVTVNTGLAPSAQVVENQWALSWIAGLIPPNTVNTKAQCPKGASQVESQLSFPNLLVGMLTFSIFTPMTIKVTCAA